MSVSSKSSETGFQAGNYNEWGKWRHVQGGHYERTLQESRISRSGEEKVCRSSFVEEKTLKERIEGSHM